MRNMVVLFVALALFVSGEVVAQAPETQTEAPKPIQIEKIAIGTGLESRELVGEATEFDVAARRLYCWTKVTSQKVPTTIKHVWYAGAEKAAEVPLDIKYPTTRTWSSKVIWPGTWRVDVVSETGEVLASIDLAVKAQPGPAAP